MCVQADLSRCFTRQVLWAVEDAFVGYKDVLGYSKALSLMVGKGSGLLRRSFQRCVGARGLPVSSNDAGADRIRH
jgi:hypothetical protein